jgi:hypothetical protein
VVDHELTPEWLDHYDNTAWSDYSPPNHKQIMMPVLGPPRYYNSIRDGVVVPIEGKRFLVKLLYDCRSEPWNVIGYTLIMDETDLPESEYEAIDYEYRSCQLPKSGVYFFTQPHWIQCKSYPADLHGRPCYPLLTDENGWCDSGNVNVLLGLDLNGIPEIAYFEASCC